MEDLSDQETLDAPLPRELSIFTKLLAEPVVTAGSSYRTGSHPVLKVKIAAEVSRSPKVGLIGKLLAEGKEAFRDRRYRVALVKFLAIEELLRKYGDILRGDVGPDIQDELDFLKIQFYLLSGQAAEACRTLKNLNYKGSLYLAHRRYAGRYGLDFLHWRDLASALRQIFKTNGCGRIFALLGYVTVMGQQPYVAKSLSLELGFTPDPGDDVFQPFLLRHHNLVTECSPSAALWLPESMVRQFSITPLSKELEVLYLGVAVPLTPDGKAQLESMTGVEVVEVPVSPDRISARNGVIYGFKKTA